MKHPSFIFALWIISGHLTCTALYGFTLNNNVTAAFTKDSGEVAMHVADVTCNNIGLSPGEILNMLEEAAEGYWNKVSTSKLRLKRGFIQTDLDRDAYYNDPLCSEVSPTGNCIPTGSLIGVKDIIVTCNINDTDFPDSSPGTLAITLPNDVADRSIQGAIIKINDKSFSGSNPFASLSRKDQVAVLAHELGHAVGLGHSNVEDSLMFFQTVPVRNELGQDDIDGITYLYPRRDKFLGILGCGRLDFGGGDAGGGEAPLGGTRAMGNAIAFLLGWLLLRAILGMVRLFAKNA